MFSQLFILVFMNCVNNCLFFHVNFQYFYGAQLEPFNTQIQKREMAQFFDKAAYSFNGLDKVESVPVPFPIDICILLLESVKYAAALHKNKNGVRHFTIYKNLNHNYREILTIATPNATAMDCKTLGPKGYIALAFNVTQPIENARDGSPIYELTADGRLRAVQYFAAAHLYSIYLRTTGNDLFMLQTFRSIDKTSESRCPYYKWSSTSFTLLARIPCSNARHVEPFAINYENYVALANYADPAGRTTTYSEIYKFVREKKQFQLVQKIRTYGAVDVRYFSVPLDDVRRRHFLIYGNSVSRRRASEGDVNEADSVFYLFDKGQFVPFQSLSLYAVEQFLPVQNMEAEKFLLLVASKDQDIKIYNLNDWKFEPSNVQFTEGALSQGVSKMRIYEESEKSYLVIANEKMNENDTNIFLPIFKQDEHANALRQQIIDWTNAQIERLSQIDVNKLKNDVEQKLAQTEGQNRNTNFNFQVRDIPQSHIQTATTNSFIYPKHRFNGYYWQSLNFATQAVNGLEAELKAITAKRLKRATTVYSDQIEEFANIKVDTLVVKEHLHAKQVNSVESAYPTLEHIKAKKVRVTGKYQASERTPANDVPALATTTSSMTVKHLRINGNLNEYKWQNLLNYTLKHEGVQLIEQPAHIGSLVSESVRVLSDEIDDNHLHKLIPIDRGGGADANVTTYVVNQSILFEGPMKAKELLIHERLNHIQVRQNKLDVLLKYANETQVVEGPKSFPHVRILQPITMAVSEGGQMLGSRLQSLSSQQIIHDDLILDGDFTIKGDAIVSDFLSVDDLIDLNAQISAKQSLLNGLDITQSLEDINVKFQHPLEANNTLLTFVNAVDLQQLIKTNFKHLQVLEGEKHFKKTLEIHKGFSEVKYLNGIDTEGLTERLLLKSTNQSVKAPMHFGKIQVSGITAAKIKMKNKPLESFLTRNGNQHMPITLTVRELGAQTLNVDRLHTKGRIFGKSMSPEDEQSLIAQLLFNQSRHMDLLPPSQKFPNTIFVNNLRLKDGSINGRNVHDIEKHLEHLNKDIKFEGNYKFNYDINISQLTFQGKFNDIAAEVFGSCWLQKSGMQVFTSPQSFSEVHCPKGVQLYGALNGHVLEDFYEKTFWINRNEYIDAIKFHNPIHMQAPLDTTTLNSMHILDIIHSNSSVSQILYASSSVNGDISIMNPNGIYNVSTLNGVHLLGLQQFLKTVSGDTLHVEHANFVQMPLFRTLNHYELQTLLDRVWLANENVRLTQHVELANATFEGLLEFEGLVNNINLRYLKDNYLSLTRPQEIETEVILTNEAKFEGDLTAKHIQLAGFLVDSSSDLATNFNEFVANTLKIDGPHEVCASWSLLTALVHGDVENVQINNLNLAHDVVRLDMPHASLTASKIIKSSSIAKLSPARSSTINGVPVVDWLQQAVYVHGNHSISGIVTLDTVNMYNDLSVLGIVNNISNFGEETLLLRNLPQTLHGNMYINNLFPKKHRILVNNFENLRAKSVNGQKVDGFYKEQAKLSGVVTSGGNLVFTQPLVVQDYHNRDSSEMNGERKSSTIDAVMRASNNFTQAPNWKATFTVVRKLRESLKAPFYTLNKFNIRQKLKANATKLVSFKITEENGKTLDVIGVVDETNKTSPVQYYKWSIQDAQFRLIQEHTWLPKKKDFIELLAFSSSDIDSFIALNRSTALHLISSLQSFFEKSLGEQKITIRTSLTIAGEWCFATLKGPAKYSLGIFCVKKELDSPTEIYENILIPRNDIKQLLQLDREKIALLLPDCVEIWRLHPNFEFLQLLPLLKATKIASVEFKNNTFLAVQFEKESNSLRSGTLDIYHSFNSTHFDYLQSLDIVEPIQFSFSKIALTDDLLLYILSRSVVAPLSIYQYKGVSKFKRIVGTSTLPVAQQYKILDLENTDKPLIMLMNDGDLTFLEIMLLKF